MEPELFARRASSFGAAAADYHRHRPGYPVEAVAWAVGDAERVLDLAAGTGKLTEALLDLGIEVTAVEPDERLREWFHRLFPDVAVRDGTAEAIPLRDACVDAVVVGQAYHWFDQAAAIPEMLRVLRPGGVLATLANHDDQSVPWVAELASLATTSIGPPRNHAARVPEHPGLKPPEQVQVHHAQRRTAASMLETVKTHSNVSQAPAAERAEVLTRVRDFLSANPATSTGEFDRPLITTVIRAAKR
ncbi:class I SAM-dependent methyltransferase [Actinokineospora bangkokensis]|uniref:Methyltransferase type 11 n=1 Tax=Actinokineospora bangkokensis TaxID=1193682 RepID=A0A1Q9LCK6_9PSEU|nr:class I SAM-dependent methyltransferase [Actinokineospora bangkokensis]OLR89761.1 methyltransferase type 11 [Actinokineospora bangkokensis]